MSRSMFRSLLSREATGPAPVANTGYSILANPGRLLLPDNAVMTNRLQTFTVECWAKYAVLDRLFGSITPFGAGGDEWMFHQHGTGFGFYGSSNRQLTGVVAVDTWTHIGCWRDATANQFGWIINGVKGADTGALGLTAGAFGSNFRRLLADNSGENYRGRITGLRIWDKNRTSVEIAADYNKLLSGSETNLLAYWPMNDGTGTTVTGYGSAAVNATFDGTLSPSWVLDAPTWVP